MTGNRLRILMLAASVIMVVSGPAHAGLVLEFEEPGVGLLFRVEDNNPTCDLPSLPCDSNPAVGMIGFNVDNRRDGPFAVVTVVSKPVIPVDPEAAAPESEIQLQNLVLAVNLFRYPNDLVISVTDTDFTFPASLAEIFMEGSFFGGSLVEHEWFGDTLDQEFGRGFESGDTSAWSSTVP